MKLPLPKSEMHPLVEIEVIHRSGFRSVTTADISLTDVDIETPEGVDTSELGITARFCNARGQHDERMAAVVIQEAAQAEEPKESESEEPEEPEAPAEDVEESAESSDEELEALTEPDPFDFGPNDAFDTHQ